MAGNYYQILGVSASASEAEIKSAYKKLAVQYHPDKNPGSDYHEERFKEISEAYNTLSDKRRRSVYDFKLIYGAVNNYGQAVRTSAAAKVRPRYNQYRRHFRSRFVTQPASFKVRSTAFALLFTSFIFWYYIKIFMDRVTADDFVKTGNYEMALEFDEKNPEAYFMRGEIFQKQYNDLPAALHDYNKAIQYAPYARAEYYYARAVCLLRLKRHKESLNDFKKTVHLQPENDTAQYIVGDLHTFVFNDYEEGLEAFKKASAINPKYYDAIFGEGYCYLYLKENSKALERFESAMKLNDKDAALYYYRGFAHLEVTDSLTACIDWNNALLMGNESARSALDRFCKNKINYQ